MGPLTGTSTQYSFLSGNFTNSYSYDADSNRTGYTAPDGSTNTYGYDNLNRLVTLANSWAGSFGFSYDALSRRTQMTRPNGVATNYAYDSLSRLLSVLHQLSGSTIDGASYGLDNAGNRISKTDWLANVTSNYSYDAIYELTQVMQGANTTESYSYDPVGNRLGSLGVSPYNVNSSNELTSTPSTSYSYDANGSLTSETNSTGTTTYSWDFENRMTQVTLPNSGGTVTFRYDPFGRRVEKISPTATSVFAYDGYNLIETVNGSGSEVAHYAQTQNVDELLAMQRSSATDYYEADGLGSVTSLTAPNGSVLQDYTYDSFGNVTSSQGSQTNFLRYTGREFDTETNLYYYRARYYDPSAGRFLAEDSTGFGTGVDWYNYVAGNPLRFVDPLGLQQTPSPPNNVPGNCLSWALGYDEALGPGHDGTDSSDPNWRANWMAHNTGCKPIDCNKNVSCKTGRRKIVGFSDPADHTNWHFMRQQCDGTWTSKNGDDPVVSNIPNADDYYKKNFSPSPKFQKNCWSCPWPSPGAAYK